METKLIEIRDHFTCIVGIAISMDTPSSEAERWLLMRAGYGQDRLILLARADGKGTAFYDPYEWSSSEATMRDAHLYLEQSWDHINSGDVIDARVGRGEATEVVPSERFECPPGWNK